MANATQNPLSDTKTIAPLSKYHSVNPFNSSDQKEQQLKGFSNDDGSIPTATVAALPSNATQSIVSQFILQAGQRPTIPASTKLNADQAEINRLTKLISDIKSDINYWTGKRNDAESGKNSCPKIIFTNNVDTSTDCYRAREGDKNDANSKLDTLNANLIQAKSDLSDANDQYDTDSRKYSKDLKNYQDLDASWIAGLNSFIAATTASVEKLNQSDPTLQAQRLANEANQRQAQQQALATQTDAATTALKEKNKKIIIVLIIVVVLLGVLGTAAYFLVPEIKK